MKRKKVICLIIISVLTVAAGYCGMKAALCLIEKKNAMTQYEQLSSMTDVYGDNEKEGSKAADLFAAYREMKEMNNDLAGWIKIDGTNIDYPVMQSPAEVPEYYLDHAFDRTYSVYGVPFLDSACKIGESNNLIIYGHRMKDGTMFGNIGNYQDEEFCKEHEYVSMDTTDEHRRYQVVAVFLYDTDHDSFRFRQYTDMDMTEFAYFMKCIHERELYDTGTDAVYGDSLLTLSTCDYTYANGRIVLVAKEVG